MGAGDEQACGFYLCTPCMFSSNRYPFINSLLLNLQTISLLFSQHSEINKNLNSSGKFPVIVHANYCNGKSHELAVRGLWLLGDNYTDTDSTQCRSYHIDRTHYNIFNWSQEVQQIDHKRTYMYDTFVNNGSLVQGSNGLAVYAIDSNRRSV